MKKNVYVAGDQNNYIFVVKVRSVVVLVAEIVLVQNKHVIVHHAKILIPPPERGKSNGDMIQLQLQVRPFGTYDIEAFVEYEGKQIDCHVHSSESWLIRDWFDKDTYFTHKEKIFKKLGDQPFQLRYKTQDQKEEYLLEYPTPKVLSDRGE